MATQPRRFESAGGMPVKEPSGWAVGWTAFAGIMMVMMGGWWILAGLVALINRSFFVLTQDYIFKFSTVTWGWIHLIVGALVLAAGLSLFSGAVWARVVGVIIALIAGLVAFAWLPWYPIWAILFITVSASVIWALTAHGRDITMT